MPESPTAKPTGFWQVPPEVWTDEQTMDEFAKRARDHITAASQEAYSDKTEIQPND